MLYTRFLAPNAESSRFDTFQRRDRSTVLREWFGGGSGGDAALADAEAALSHAERQIKALARRWTLWLRTQCAMLPPVFRLDCFVVRRPRPHQLQPMSALFRIVHEPHPPMPPGISEPLKDFLSLCFRKDVGQRPGARRLRTHAWLATPQSFEPTERLPT